VVLPSYCPFRSQFGHDPAGAFWQLGLPQTKEPSERNSWMGVDVKPMDGAQRVVMVSHLWPQVVDL